VKLHNKKAEKAAAEKKEKAPTAEKKAAPKTTATVC